MHKASLLLPVIGFMLPSARLKRQIRARTDAIFKDLPDIIDMLAIAVEAGCGFDAALSIVCQHFESPMADELRLALQGMELGMPRREVLQELKRPDRPRRGPDLRAGPASRPTPSASRSGRVLTSQATEIRSRRRAWAREKAAKLPVKIMFPLVLFIFPPIMAIVIGPAVGSLRHPQVVTAASGERAVLLAEDELQPRPHVGDGADLGVHPPERQADLPQDVLGEVGGHARRPLGPRHPQRPRRREPGRHLREPPGQVAAAGDEHHGEVDVGRRRPGRADGGLRTPSGSGSSSGPKPSGAPTSATRKPSLIPSLRGSGVPE